MKKIFCLSSLCASLLLACTLAFSVVPANAGATWQAGSKMGTKIKCSELKVKVALSMEEPVSVEAEIKLVRCCVKANKDTACNTGAQDSDC